MQHGLYPQRQPDPPSIGDYEDFTAMALDPGELDALVAGAGECVFNWTTSQGFPVGVVMAYVYRHGRFWTNCTAQRKRVAALRARPQAAVVVNKDGKMATYKGNAVIHSPADDDWDRCQIVVLRGLVRCRTRSRQPPFAPGPGVFGRTAPGHHRNAGPAGAEL